MNDTDFQKYQHTKIKFGSQLSEADILQAAVRICCILISRDETPVFQLKHAAQAANLVRELIREL